LELSSHDPQASSKSVMGGLDGSGRVLESCQAREIARRLNSERIQRATMRIVSQRERNASVRALKIWLERLIYFYNASVGVKLWEMERDSREVAGVDLRDSRGLSSSNSSAATAAFCTSNCLRTHDLAVRPASWATFPAPLPRLVNYGPRLVIIFRW